MKREALIDGDFRYWLGRDWGPIAFGDYVWGAFDGVDVRTRAWELQHHLLPEWRMCRVCRGSVARQAYRFTTTSREKPRRLVKPMHLRIVGSSCSASAVLGLSITHNAQTIAEALSAKRLMNSSLRGPSGSCAFVNSRGARLAPALDRYAHRPACLEHQGNEPACSALGFTKAGAPRHPLMMPYYAVTQLQPWPARPV